MPTKDGKQTAAELRDGLRQMAELLARQRDQEAKEHAEYVAKYGAHTWAAGLYSGHHAGYRWALDCLAHYTNGEFGALREDQPTLSEPEKGEV